jgi:hypothetical protein
VPNRSASLLYYYAMLNFAKAELLGKAGAPVGGFIPHGLQFNVTAAKTAAGDSLTVRDGLFPILYQNRTGHALPLGTRLSVRRLLRQVPELGSQLTAVGMGNPVVGGLLQLIAGDGSQVWVVLALEDTSSLGPRTATGRHFLRHFRQVDAPGEWRDKFAVSRRWGAPMSFFESRTTFPYSRGSAPDQERAVRLAVAYIWNIRDVLGMSAMGMWDAWLAPSLYRTRMLPMPPALARYALTYYASSLVRYRPSMFDAQVSPEQAYLFDSLARESSVPMLMDTVSALTGRDHFFLAPDAFRL